MAVLCWLLLQVGDSCPLMLGIDPVPPAMLSWADVAPGQVGGCTATHTHALHMQQQLVDRPT